MPKADRTLLIALMAVIAVLFLQQSISPTAQHTFSQLFAR